jgi:hypothetical protein
MLSSAMPAISVYLGASLVNKIAHEELLAAKGRYAERFELQAAGYR